MNNDKHLYDVESIRKMMEESSRFLSLSGLTGIFAGIYALLGAAIAWFFVLEDGSNKLDYSVQYFLSGRNNDVILELSYIAITVLILAMITGFIFSFKKAKKAGKPFWTRTAKKMFMQMSIPLIAGGFFILAMIINNSTSFIASSMLIFYGLSLVGAGKYTFGEVHYLGITEIITGIISLFFLDYGLWFWIVGFGFLHIFYGTAMWVKYK